MSNDARGRRVTLVILTYLVAAIFLFTGGTKLVGAQMSLDSFERWGYPAWIRLSVGFAEVVGALMLLLPRTAWVACGGLAILLIGAILTHLNTPGEAVRAVVPLVVLFFLGMITYARRPGLDDGVTGKPAMPAAPRPPVDRPPT